MFHPSSRSFCWWVNPPYSNISKCHVVVRMSCLMLHDISQYISIKNHFFSMLQSVRPQPSGRSVVPAVRFPQCGAGAGPGGRLFGPRGADSEVTGTMTRLPWLPLPNRYPRQTWEKHLGNSSNMGLCSNPWKSLVTKWEFQRFQLENHGTKW